MFIELDIRKVASSLDLILSHSHTLGAPLCVPRATGIPILVWNVTPVDDMDVDEDFSNVGKAEGEALELSGSEATGTTIACFTGLLA